MKVYVVSEWEDDSNHIEIFSTRELAEAYCGKTLDPKWALGNDPHIEEYELDTILQREHWVIVYVCRIRLSDGEALSVPHSSSYSKRVGIGEVGSTMVYGVADLLDAYSYLSPEHALELAHERRQEWVREQVKASTWETT